MVQFEQLYESLSESQKKFKRKKSCEGHLRQTNQILQSEKTIQRHQLYKSKSIL